LASKESRWRSLRDEWTEEKLAAERIIRDLLNQLEPAIDPAGMKISVNPNRTQAAGIDSI
jgi:hypothetical protein